MQPLFSGSIHPIRIAAPENMGIMQVRAIWVVRQWEGCHNGVGSTGTLRGNDQWSDVRSGNLAMDFGIY